MFLQGAIRYRDKSRLMDMIHMPIEHLGWCHSRSSKNTRYDARANFLREPCDLILIGFPLSSVVTLINDS